MRLDQETVERVLASFDPMRVFKLLDSKTLAALADIGKPCPELLKLLAKYGPDFLHATAPDDPYEDALEIQQARRSFRIVRPDEDEEAP